MKEVLAPRVWERLREDGGAEEFHALLTPETRQRLHALLARKREAMQTSDALKLAKHERDLQKRGSQ
jgi:hypothetical protein